MDNLKEVPCFAIFNFFFFFILCFVLTWDKLSILCVEALNSVIDAHREGGSGGGGRVGSSRAPSKDFERW
jgi:hypothetical protein